MKKYFVVSDVHSFYTEMKQALDNAGFDIANPDHIFVSCGDLFDRGGEATSCLDFVLSIPENRRVLIRGNHEYLLNNIRRTHSFYTYDKTNGTLDTIKQLTGVNYIDQVALHKLSNHQKLTQYFFSLVNYYETDKYIFVHSWLPFKRCKDNWRNADASNWDDATWTNPFDEWAYDMGTPERQEEFLRRIDGKTVIFGHWHTSYAHCNFDKIGVEFPTDDKEHACFEPYYASHIIGIDGCTAFTHKVNCIVLEDN